jgi:dTDP-4-dehydrorhamnose 3,5-epimerase-like enzyme
MGEQFTDDRGSLNFFNAFDMSEIKRLYEIEPYDESIIRAWQGHRYEKKWLYCSSGSFVINLIELDDFETPSNDIVPKRFLLEAKKPSILEISGGYANGFKATQPDSKLVVFSNFNLEESKVDDFRYPLHLWKVAWD